MFVLKIFLVILVIGGLTGAIYLFSQSKKESHKRFRSLGLIVVLVVVLALLLLGLIRFGNIFAAIWIFNVLTDKISSTTGWDIWLTRAIAIPITALIVWLLTFIFSFQKKRRQLGYGLLAVLAVMMCLGMFGLTKDTYFNYQTGASERWYAATPEGYRLFDAPGFDPKYRIELQPVTPEIQRKIDSWQAEPSQVKVSSDKEEIFFNMITGEPCQWYYQADDGSYEFFSKPGTHPKYGIELKPVTKEAIKDWEARKAKTGDEKVELEKKLKNEETRARGLENEKIRAEKERIELHNQLQQSRAESEKSRKEKAEAENQQKQLQAKVDKEKAEVEKSNQGGISLQLESIFSKNENGVEFVVKNNSQNDDKFVVVTKSSKTQPKSWSFRVPKNKLVTRPAEIGWYELEIFRDGYKDPVNINSFEVFSEKIKELDGNMYNGGFIITGE